jgi:hypothetical protein
MMRLDNQDNSETPVVDDLGSAVVVNQCQSKYVTVSEGDRQELYFSGLLYLVFINDDLLVELEQCMNDISR